MAHASQDEGWKKSALEPSHRFSQYFIETKGRCRVKRTGLWLKKLDTDTIDDLYNVLLQTDIHSGKMDEGSDLFKDFVDFCTLCAMLLEWETGNPASKPAIPNQNDVDKQAEYYYRLARLVNFCYNVRHKMRNKILSEDNKKYKGKLAIYE